MSARPCLQSNSLLIPRPWPACPVCCPLQVEQSYALVGMEEQFAAIYAVLRQHMQETPGARGRLPAAGARGTAAAQQGHVDPC